MTEHIKKIMQEIGSNAKVAYERLSTASNEEKNDALHIIANEIENNEEYILSENNKDIQIARSNNLSEAMIDRLSLNDIGIKNIA